jgi:uncharacterized protein YndB with AHSA1/START domain
VLGLGDVVAVERIVPADPQSVFDILADPTQHPVLDGSGSVRRARAGHPVRLSKGARFGMEMNLGLPYRISNTVVEFDEPRRIAWRHFAGHRWRYLLTPVDAGTLVREEWDPRRVPHLWLFFALSRFPARNRAGMRASLERLAQMVSAGP